jgi:CpXC protein
MSKTYEIQEECPACNYPFEIKMYRSIWGVHPENRELVMSDSVNRTTCKNCGLKITIQASLFYTNASSGFAVWYEPVPDPQIDTDQYLYTQLGGASFYLAKAPRIKDWNEFKNTIIKFETGQLEGGTPFPNNMKPKES